MTETETESLLKHSEWHPPILLPESVKGRCWCCWQTQESKLNRLIRACRGCKDIDLQYIHQECIDKYISLQSSSYPSSTESQSYYCSRCKDVYKVELTPVHPLVSVYEDKYLFTSMMIITACMISLSVCSILLINQQVDTTLFYIPVWIIALLMLFLCHFVNTIAWLIVLKHFSGRMRSHVLEY